MYSNLLSLSQCIALSVQQQKIEICVLYMFHTALQGIHSFYLLFIHADYDRQITSFKIKDTNPEGRIIIGHEQQ